MSFGYGRAEIVAALVNYTVLIVITVWLGYEAVVRLLDPPEVTVIVGGVLIWAFDWRPADPVITLLMSGRILWHALTEIGPVIRIQMLAAPR